MGGLWLFNLLAWADLPSPLERYQEPTVEVVEEETVLEEPAEGAAAADEALGNNEVNL